MSVSSASAPTSTAPLKAPMVFSGNFALYPRWAMAWGLLFPDTSFRAYANEALWRQHLRMAMLMNWCLPLGKLLLGPSSGCSTILSSCLVRPSNTGGTPTTIFSRMGVCTSNELSKSCSAMMHNMQMPTAPLANNLRQDQRTDEARAELSGLSSRSTTIKDEARF